MNSFGGILILKYAFSLLDFGLIVDSRRQAERSAAARGNRIVGVIDILVG